MRSHHHVTAIDEKSIKVLALGLVVTWAFLLTEPESIGIR